MDPTITISSGAIAALVLEGIKWLIRKIIKNVAYDFPKAFYLISIPVLNILVQPLLAWIGYNGYTIPTDWVGWLRGIIMVLIGSLVSLVTYDYGIKNLKLYEPIPTTTAIEDTPPTV